MEEKINACQLWIDFVFLLRFVPFTCFAYPTFTEEDCEQIGDALKKVILSFSK